MRYGSDGTVGKGHIPGILHNHDLTVEIQHAAKTDNNP